MKKIILLSLTAMMAAGLAAKADDCGGYNCICTNNCGNTNESGCTNNRDGGFHQELRQVIVLTASSNTPTNAAGAASLKSDTDDATNRVELEVTVAGLNTGTYHVSVTDITGTNVFDLGTVDVIPLTPSLRELEGDGSSCSAGTNIVNVGSSQFSLPSGLDATNVAFLFVYDTNGVVDLTGDFTSLTNMTALVYNETVSVIPGTASRVQGHGTLSLAYKKGKTTGSFKLDATGLTPRQTLYLKANGVSSATASTSTKGALKVQRLPRVNLANLQDLEAKDKTGNVVFSLKF
jgi:hypothetical protein